MLNKKLNPEMRTNRVGDELVELRILVPRPVLNVADATAIAETRLMGKMVSRTDICNRILLDWVEAKVDEATLILQAIGDNPTVLE